MALKVCAEPGCPALVRTTRCPTHTRERDAARGRRQARGYDAEHDAVRKRWEPLVASGNVRCWRCGEYLKPSQAWDLGHADGNRSVYKGPECRPCNRATSGRM